MPNRREFIHSGVVVSAFAMNGLAPQGAAAMSAARSRTVRVQRAVYDLRYAAARRFGAAVAGRGVAVRELVDGDLTRFWYDELAALWQREPAAVAGMTQFGPMFALGQLGAERGMQLVLQVLHRAADDGSLSHEVTAAEPTLVTAAELGAAGLDWPTAMALLACTCAAGEGPPHTAVLRPANPLPAPSAEVAAETRAQPSIIHYYTPLAVQQGFGVALDGPLYTWLLAPAAGRRAPLAAVRS